MWEAVRPGGVLIATDADFGGLFCDPPNEGFRLYAKNYQRVLELNGGDPALARKLYRCFLAAGLPHPQIRMTQIVGTGPDSEAKTPALTTLEAITGSITSAGLATQAEIDRAIADLAA